MRICVCVHVRAYAYEYVRVYVHVHGRVEVVVCQSWSLLQLHVFVCVHACTRGRKCPQANECVGKCTTVFAGTNWRS